METPQPTPSVLREVFKANLDHLRYLICKNQRLLIKYKFSLNYCQSRSYATRRQVKSKIYEIRTILEKLLLERKVLEKELLQIVSVYLLEIEDV